MSSRERLADNYGSAPSLQQAERISADTWRKIKEGRVGGYRVLTGERPTGALHIGHYFGSIAPRLALQKLGIQTWILIADYQALTDRDSSAAVADSVKELIFDYLAVGLDVLNNGVAFCHSAVPELNQLMLPLLSIVSVGEIDRNPTVKTEIANLGNTRVSGLMYNYPVHQAADILACRGNIVPGGRDQLPHIELCRKIARRFNKTYCPASPVFDPPVLLFGEAPLLLGTDGKKMGKSAQNAIFIKDNEDATARLLSRAVTDSDPQINFNPDGRPAVSNLLTLAACASGNSVESVVDEVQHRGAKGLKLYVTEAVNEHFREIRARRRELEQDKDIVAKVLSRGQEVVRQQAKETLDKVHEAMGLDYANFSVLKNRMIDY